MDLDEIRRVIELMKENDLAEFEFESEGHRIRIRRGYDALSQMNGPGLTLVGPGGALQAQTEQGADAGEEEDDLIEIVSPIVGTFYRSPSPESPSYADAGTAVDDETVVCIVEAMKVMNEIKAECRGTIIRVLVDNGSAVEFGQPLFLVRPAS
jgi:acetyl-CoA carboxylase biotin carboxyl carrier protein